MTTTDYSLPMFPLEHPVLPSQLVPLTLFEPRYLALAEYLKQQPEPEFGIVGIQRGREVGGDDVRADVGVVARVLELSPLPDDRWRLVATTTRRIRVTAWLADAPFPWATVSDWPDEFDGDLANDLDRVVQAVAQLLDAAQRHHRIPGLEMPSVDPDQPDLALWRLVAFCGLGPLDSLELLEIPTGRLRAQRAIELIDLRRELVDGLGPDER